MLILEWNPPIMKSILLLNYLLWLKNWPKKRIRNFWNVTILILKTELLYHIHVNKPPVVYKKIKVVRWRIIEIFPKFAQKSPKKWAFWAKKWWFI